MKTDQMIFIYLTVLGGLAIVVATCSQKWGKTKKTSRILSSTEVAVSEEVKVQFRLSQTVSFSHWVTELVKIEWLFKAIPYIPPKPPTHPHPIANFAKTTFAKQRRHLPKQRRHWPSTFIPIMTITSINILHMVKVTIIAIIMTKVMVIVISLTLISALTDH